MKRQNQKFTLLLVGVICLSVGLFLASSFDWPSEGTANPIFAPAEQNPQESEVGESLQNLIETEKAFTDISRKITPSVVTISAEKIVKNPHMGLEESPFYESPFEEFFKRFQPPEGEFKTEGLGSGLIVKGDGYILTNNHVVENAEEIKVTLSTNKTYEARIVGRDPTTDVAVIKITGADFPAAPLGNSDAVEVGQWALAIGNPMRLTSTVTAGIVSALGRNINIIPGSYSIENFIQTDAVINPGNSGGPLVNLRGEVIGINSAISTRTGFYQGYGFAIPINLAKRIMEDLIEYKRVIRPILGIQIRNITPELAEALGLMDPIGVLVEDFTQDISPARDAGVERRDVITEVDGVKVRQTNELQSLIAQRHPGDVVELSIIRDKKPFEINVKLAERQEDVEVAIGGSETQLTESSKLGMDVESLTSEIAEQLGMEFSNGVIVTQVDPNGPASEASPFPIRRRDIIIEMGKSHKINSVQDYEEILGKFEPGNRVLLYIARPVGGSTSKMYTSIKVPK
jgi:serine protease Do